MSYGDDLIKAGIVSFMPDMGFLQYGPLSFPVDAATTQARSRYAMISSRPLQAARCPCSLPKRTSPENKFVTVGKPSGMSPNLQEYWDKGYAGR
jgi:hypothetical protein